MSINSKYVTPQFKKEFNPKIGLITLSTDLTMENDFYSISKDLPVDVFVNRIKNYNPLTKENLLKMYDQLEAVTKNILPDEKINTVAYGCTSWTIAIGKDKIKEKREELDKLFKLENAERERLQHLELEILEDKPWKTTATAEIKKRDGWKDISLGKAHAKASKYGKGWHTQTKQDFGKPKRKKRTKKDTQKCLGSLWFTPPWDWVYQIMKQQYRYTKPYRGKDPNFEKEELIENENNDNLQRRLKVSRKLKKTFNKWSRKSFCRKDLGPRGPPARNVSRWYSTT